MINNLILRTRLAILKRNLREVACALEAVEGNRSELEKLIEAIGNEMAVLRAVRQIEDRPAQFWREPGKRRRSEQEIA